METPEETAPHLVSFITILQIVGSLGNAHGSDAHDAPNLVLVAKSKGPS